MALRITDSDRKLMKEWKGNWGKFAHDVLKVRLASWQEEGLHLIQHNKRTSFCTGTSFGKDFLGSVASWCFLLLTPEFDINGILQTALVINTGPSAAQVSTIMLGELKARYTGSALPKLVEAGLWNFRIRQDGVVFDVPDNLQGKKEFSNYPNWKLEAFKGDQYSVERWQGFHNENIMVVMTEATGIPELIYNGVYGCLQNNSRLVLLHNANIASGTAYNSLRDSQFVSRRISAFESDNYILGKKYFDGLISKDEYDKERFPGQVNYDWVKDHILKPGWTLRIKESEMDKSKHDFEFEGKFYRPSTVCGIKILAVHPESDTDSLIPLTWIEAAQSRWLEKSKPTIKGIRGVDCAGMGTDTSVFADRYDYYLDELKVPVTPDPNLIHTALAGAIKIESELFDSIMVDAIGDGAGVFSILKEHGCKNVYAFKNSYGAKGLKDKTEARKFLNMRSYTHWAMRDWLDPRYDSVACLPPDDELKAQLTEIKYKIRSDGSIQIEEKDEIKKRLGVSPDKSDALAQTFAPIDRLIAAIEKKFNRVRPGRFGG